MKPQIGRVFDGRYVIRRVVAESELGTIYAADHRFMERSVAIHLASDDVESSERLEREGRLLDRARSRFVVRLLDVGEAGEGRRFLVTDPIQGRSLDGVLAVRGTLTDGEAVALGLDVASALQAAHAAGVVHQGLCPASILCVDSPVASVVAQILDFGAWPSPLGQFGGSLGAMAYAAPERFSGMADPTCDVHALGAVLYEAVTGGLPPREQRSAHALAKTVDRRLAKVIARSLDTLEHRYTSMEEFRDALKEATLMSSVRRAAMVAVGDTGLSSAEISSPGTGSGSGVGLLDIVEQDTDPSAPPSVTFDDEPVTTPRGAAEESIRPEDRRVHPRVGYVTPVRIRRSKQLTIDGRAHAIGEGGMLILVHDPLALHEIVTVRFALPTSGRVVTVDAEIRWIRDSTNRRAVGVMFETPDPVLVQDIREYVWLMGS